VKARLGNQCRPSIEKSAFFFFERPQIDYCPTLFKRCVSLERVSPCMKTDGIEKESLNLMLALRPSGVIDRREVQGSEPAVLADEFRVFLIVSPVNVNNHPSPIQHEKKHLLSGGEVGDSNFFQKILNPAEAQAHVWQWNLHSR
jgi:hypothetical protein